ncbi:hypothetical protein M422DRAFT_262547 [Sphaerobolus stellatus SS14]|uniref:Lysophospholipase n=1 Tax=Sphaerobolus stellatus (strain SS14) TaxID=990650 RepID=A0A0C9VCB0_SPHS4|nr:hypothetical protein M422DRAFT_262547 [Sphaerobolus stellatus SS14]
MSLNSNTYPTTSRSGCTNSFRPVAPEQPLSRDETAYIAARLAVVQAAWEDWVGDASQLGYSSRQDALNNATIIGIASGGGVWNLFLFLEIQVSLISGRFSVVVFAKYIWVPKPDDGLSNMTLHTQTPTNGNELQAWRQRMVYKVTPYEMGSHDPRLNAMSATQYFGTHATNGKPNNDRCRTGFDEGSLIIGTSGSPLYEPNVTGFGSDGSTTLNNILAKLKS